MPTYSYRNKETGEEEEHILPISQRDTFIEDKPHLERIFTLAPQVIHNPGTLIKGVDSRFKERVSEIQKTHTVNNINRRNAW